LTGIRFNKQRDATAVSPVEKRASASVVSDVIVHGRKRMLQNTKLQAIIMVALGVLLGYAAAFGHFKVSWPLPASPGDKQAAVGDSTSPQPGACPGAGCCQEGIPSLPGSAWDREQLLSRSAS
jgi:hypothetical protein